MVTEPVCLLGVVLLMGVLCWLIGQGWQRATYLSDVI
jgi:hypothetical protein